ncbi:MAG: hypothetical protein K2X27_18350 [Candidatus Obscuribacterales bacterium]|nr:hypothetical protein [Candidatus Obscuribacterales bacterium]
MQDQITSKLGPVGPEQNTARSSSKQSGSQLKSSSRKNTITYLLEELQQHTKPIPETFESVDRGLPIAPAALILKRAVQSCQALFLEQQSSITDSRDELIEAICSLADENLRFNCASNMLAFESRLADQYSETADNEIRKTYKQLTCLLTHQATDRSLPWQSRLLACSHFLSHLAKPETLCQGNKIAAQVICLSQKLVTKQPSRLAEMICSASIFGKWQSFDGKYILLEEHCLKPAAEEIIYSPGEHRRSYAAKIIQVLLLNNCLMRRSQPMVYSETPGRPGRDYNGQIVRSLDGTILNPKTTAALGFLELALLARFEFNENSTILVNDLSFASDSPEYEDRNKHRFLQHFSSVNELSDLLLQAKNQDSLPVTIAVDERRLLADSYKDGINHAVNVLAFNEYGLLKVFNPQLLPGMQRVARLTTQKLYNATLSVHN